LNREIFLALAELFGQFERITFMGAHVAGDHELWERIRGRDASAFEAFYRENAARLCAFLRQVVGSPQAAEDLMQETFTQVWKSPNGFRPELGSLRICLWNWKKTRSGMVAKAVTRSRCSRGGRPGRIGARKGQFFGG
jgi:hypothetical protein